MLESEIRPDDLMAEQQVRFARDIEWLNGQQHRFVVVDCPTCQSADSTMQWRKHEITYRRCVSCGTVYVSPRPGPDLLDEYYRRSENYAYWNEMIFPASEDARRKVSRERAERIFEFAEGTLIDVGAGFGTFCEEATRFFDVIAVEPEPHLAATCRRKGIRTIEAGIGDAELPEVDVITAFEVIEHLFSPREFIRQCFETLADDGLLVLTCPNVEGWEIAVLGRQSQAVDPEHLNLMHPESLEALLEDEGFTVIESETPGKLDVELVAKGIDSDQALEDLLFGESPMSVLGLYSHYLVSTGKANVLQETLVAAHRSSHMWIVVSK